MGAEDNSKLDIFTEAFEDPNNVKTNASLPDPGNPFDPMFGPLSVKSSTPDGENNNIHVDERRIPIKEKPQPKSSFTLIIEKLKDTLTVEKMTGMGVIALALAMLMPAIYVVGALLTIAVGVNVILRKTNTESVSLDTKQAERQDKQRATNNVNNPTLAPTGHISKEL